jgi:hypothetical protein
MGIEWLAGIGNQSANPLAGFFLESEHKHHGHIMDSDEYENAMEGPDCVLVDRDRYDKEKK